MYWIKIWNLIFIRSTHCRAAYIWGTCKRPSGLSCSTLATSCTSFPDGRSNLVPLSKEEIYLGCLSPFWYAKELKTSYSYHFFGYVLTKLMCLLRTTIDFEYVKLHFYSIKILIFFWHWNTDLNDSFLLYDDFVKKENADIVCVIIT